MQGKWPKVLVFTQRTQGSTDQVIEINLFHTQKFTQNKLYNNGLTSIM